MLYKIDKVILAFLIATILCVFPCFATTALDLPELNGRVNDFTSSLGESEISELEGKLSAFEQKKGTQIAIAIVSTTGSIPIEEYAVKLQEKWKIGRKDLDDGVLIVIAKNDRKLRIEVGYGLEGAIPDALAKRIIEEVIAPEFRQGNFYQGINQGIDRIIGLVEGESLPEPRPPPPTNIDSDYFGTVLILIAVLLQPFHSILKKIIGNFPSALIFSLGVGTIAYAFLPLVFVVILMLIILLTLLLGTAGGGRYSTSSWGGSSGGGFSGGGGRSGGGGASGSW